MKKKVRNLFLVVVAISLTALFCLLPNIQALLIDWHTFGKSEKIALSPVEISVESTQTTLEKLKIVNRRVLSVAVTPSLRTVDGKNLEKTTKKQVNELFRNMKISYRVDDQWDMTYKKLYTFITKQGNATMTDTTDVANMSNIKNALVWFIVMTPKYEKENDSIALIMDAYTDQILAIDVFLEGYQKDRKDIADHLEDIPKGFISYLNLQESEEGRKKNLQENTNILEQYKNAKKKGASTYRGISGTGGVYAVQDGKQIYVPIEWSGYGFMINSVYD